MKKIKNYLLIVMFIFVSVFASGCFLTDDENINNVTGINVALSESEILTQLIGTRNDIREFNIYIETRNYELSHGMFIVNEKINLGSGFVFASDEEFYYALTNYHVIDSQNYSNTEYTVEDFNNNSYSGILCSGDASKDIAIIKFEKIIEIPLANISERNSKPALTGEFLLAVGNPQGVQNVVTFGKMLSLTTILNVDYNVIYHNVLINPGNSGGALCDISGNVVGINTWGDEYSDEKNYAIPLTEVIEYVKSVNADLLKKTA